MDREGFLAEVEELLQAIHVPCTFDTDAHFETRTLEVTVSENTVFVMGSEGWPLDIAVGKEGPYPMSQVADWQEALRLVREQKERSEHNYTLYEKHLLSATETCKTFTRMPVRYVQGHENQRPVMDVYLAEIPHIRLYRLECWNNGYVRVVTQHDENSCSVDRWFSQAKKRRPEPGTYILEAFDGVLREDNIVAALIQEEDVYAKETQVVIHKSSPKWPDMSQKFYQDLMAVETHTYIEFVV
jgi:hypothetical protein